MDCSFQKVCKTHMSSSELTKYRKKTEFFILAQEVELSAESEGWDIFILSYFYSICYNFIFYNLFFFLKTKCYQVINAYKIHSANYISDVQK